MGRTPNWKLPLGLAVALAGLWGIALYVQYVHKPDAEKAEQAEEKLFPNLEESAIASITLHDGVIEYKITCDDLESDLCKPGDSSNWSIAKPKKFKADTGAVNSLVNALKNLRNQGTIDLSTDTEEKRKKLLADYDLAPDSLDVKTKRRIEVELADEDNIVIYFGAQHSIGDKIFAVKKTGDEANLKTVYLLASYFKNNLDNDLSHWRNKSLFGFKANDVVGFKASGSKGRLSGERKDGAWELTSGGEKGIPGDDESVTSWISALGFLKAKSFEKRPKGKKVLSVDLTFRDKESKAVHADFFYSETKKEKSLYANVAGEPEVFVLDGNSKDRIVKGLRDLRRSQIFSSVERFTAKHVELSGGTLEKELKFTKAEGKWKYDSASMGKEVDQKKLRTMLEKVSGKRIKDFLTKAPAGEAKGVKFRLITDKEEAEWREVNLWKSAGKVYARDVKSGRKDIYEVDNAVWDALPTSATYFEKVEKAEKKADAKAPEKPAAKKET